MAELIQHTVNTPYMVGPVHFYSGWFGDELVLFDTGPPTPDAEKYLKQHLDLKRLRHVFITHCHIDHYGLAGWLEKNWDVKIYLPYRDSLKIAHHDKRMETMYGLMRQLGFDDEYLVKLRQIFDSGMLFPKAPKNFLIAEEILADTTNLFNFTALSCPGHSQSDLVYVGKDWAVTGDTLLENIFQSPLFDVDLHTGERFKNYLAYCSSLVSLAGLDGKRILPGHRFSIENVSGTLQFYISKLLQRVSQLKPFLQEESLSNLVEKTMNGRLKEIFHIYLKASEILFMKDFIKQPLLLQTAIEKIGLFDLVKDQFEEALTDI